MTMEMNPKTFGIRTWSIRVRNHRYILCFHRCCGSFFPLLTDVYDIYMFSHQIQADYWSVSLVFRSFTVFHYDTPDYLGWVNFSHIGGVVAFLALIFTCALILVGLIFDNNSTFLKPESKTGPSYTSMQMWGHIIIII